MSRPGRRLAGLVAVLALSTCGGDESLGEFVPEPMAWGSCGDLLVSIDGELECGWLEVPVDHADPGGGTIDIAVARLPTAAENRIGALVLNPGGPGGSGLEFLQWFGPFVADTDLLDGFDLVSFDPRGAGVSAPVRCEDDLDDAWNLLEPGIESAEGVARMVDDNEALVAACLERNGAMVDRVGTNAVARDMDLLRQAMGEEQVSYLGYSYGTRLGAAYAGLFPDRVRAMVLDGAVDPADHPSRPNRIQADGFEESWTAFRADCDEDPGCVLAAHGGADPALDEVLRIASIEPVPAGVRAVSEAEVYLGVFSALYSPAGWPFLADALDEVLSSGTAHGLQDLGDELAGRLDAGTYDNSYDARFLVNCADDPERPSPAEVYAASEAIADSLERFGPAFLGSVGCHPLPPASDPLHVGSAELAVPALVVALEGDPATPAAWAGRLAETISEAVVVWSNAEGHGAYLAHSWCLTGPITDYLVDLVVPEDGWSCDEPDWWVEG